MQVYVQLLEEGVDVWRPVEAIEDAGLYRLIGPPHSPDDERWEFEIGELVRCEARTFSDGQTGLVAVESVRRTA